jgi:hypothetical protein
MPIRKEFSNVFSGFAADGFVAATHEAVPRELAGMRIMAATTLPLVERVRIDRLRGRARATPAERKKKERDAG